MNYFDREKWIRERHFYWCLRIEEYGRTAHGEPFQCVLNAIRPTLELDGNVRAWAGEFHRRERVCKYAVLYAFKIGDEFDETIAHEVCHAYQRSFLKDCKSHGELFYYLLRVVCGFHDAKRTHSDWDRPLLTALKLSYDIYQMGNTRNG